LNIQKIKAEFLKPAQYNPRKDLKPSSREYQKLRRSIEEFGYVEPVVWNKSTGNVVGGHQRLKVLLELGYAEIDCVLVELDAAREKALNVALNKIRGEWDLFKLRDLLETLDAGAFDIAKAGFSAGELETLAAKTSTQNLEEILKDLDMTAAIEKPIWLVARASVKNKELFERVRALLEQHGVRVERSYET